jgi:gamma-glutamyltranspeptidase/glutathione hydrolase
MLAAMMRRKLLSLILTLVVCACAGSTPPPATNLAPKAPAMVAAADPRAVDAGLAMLAKGGTATDAAIATIAVLGLVEPQSAGIGGGGFLLSFDKASGAIDAFDGREAAPAGFAPNSFLDEAGKPLPFQTAVASGRSTGAPSLIAMLKLAHEQHGKLPWATLFEPAIRLADDGFIVTPRMREIIDYVADKAVKNDPTARAYLFTKDGAPLPVGFRRKNPQYAATLRAIAKDGPLALQKGPIADAILKAVHAGPLPSAMTANDLANVKPRQIKAVCGAYRVYKVCGMPPPSSGGTTVIDILGLFERARPKPATVENPDDWAAFLWASRIAYSDRDYYLGDDTVVPVPTQQLVDPKYLDTRAKQIDLAKSAPAWVVPGDTSIVSGQSLLGHWGAPGPLPEKGTTHISIVDGYGNAVAMTASIESAFGSQRMAAGFFLNNQLTDFSFAPTLNGKPVANAAAAGKKPRSSMAPTLIFDKDGKLFAAVGSPGGSSIIAYVAKTIIGVVDWGLPMQTAISEPNVIANGETVRIEKQRFPDALATQLSARGWKFAQSTSEDSGLQGIVVRGDKLEGGADPRREGVAKALLPVN